MGYLVDIVIAVDATILSEDLINPIIPKCLKKEAYKKIDKVIYWNFENWNWYDSLPECQELEDFFNMLDSREENCFGAVWIGTDYQDIKSWGYPGDYGIDITCIISSPLNYE